MDSKIYRYIFFFLLLIFTGQAFSQAREADIQIVQSQPAGKDSVYLDFRIKRNSIAPFLLGGYNIVFDVDSAVLDTSSYKIINQGTFGNVANNYAPLQLFHIQPLVYQLVALRSFPGNLGNTLSNSYVPAGRVAFKIKKCGATGVAFHLSSPSSAMVTWIGEDVDLTFSPISPLTVSAKLNPKVGITASATEVCPSSSITLSTRPGFTDYTLFARSVSGTVSPVGTVQASSPTFTALVNDTTFYFITFKNGGSAAACADTTVTQKIKLKSAPNAPVISGSIDVCTNQTLPYSITSLSPTSTFTWSIVSAGNQSSVVGTPSGVGKIQVNVNFKATVSTTDTIKVVEQNSNGCNSVAGKLPVKVTVCTFKPDFTIEGSDTAITSCQGAQVTFKDVSTFSGGTIVGWHWDFGPGAVPSTSTQQNPPTVIYNTPGAASVKLVVTTSTGLKDSIIKQPTIKVISTLTQNPQPSCGTSGCNEVNFTWPSILGATDYRVSYKRNKGGTFTTFQSIGLALGYKVNASSFGDGQLAFNETRNDTVYFQVRAIAGKCDTTTSAIVFCRPSYCVVGTGCSLPAFTISPPSPSCEGNNVTLNVTTVPKNFSATFPAVRISWDNGKFDTAHSYTVNISQPVLQNVKFLLIDTTKSDCYSLNTITIPVTPVLTQKPDLGIQSLGCDNVTFVWRHVPGAARYEINYSGTCIAGTNGNWVPSPLGGQAEFFELTGLTNACNVNFKVRAVGGCNNTQSDTLISPPTCTCYIGHIPSSSLTSCALDTALFHVTNVQVPNWAISWTANGVSTPFSPKDSVFRFVPPQANHTGQGGNPAPYLITYTIRDLNSPSPTGCATSGIIHDSTAASGNPDWSPAKKTFCISDALYGFDSREIVAPQPRNSFSGPGITKIGSQYYFEANEAGLGTHSLTYNACGVKQSQTVSVVDKPCVSTIVDASSLSTPNGIYTTCSGVIYITDGGGSEPNAIWRYDGSTKGIPQLLMKSTATATLDSGSSNFVKIGIPAGIVVDETTENDVYFVDSERFKVKRLELDKEKLSTLAGVIGGDVPTVGAPTQPISAARFRNPWGLAIHPNAQTLYVADQINLNVKSITFKGASKNIQLLAGRTGGTSIPGLGKNIAFPYVYNIAADTAGFYVSSTNVDLNLYSYSFLTDSVKYITHTDGRFGYTDGSSTLFKVKDINGVTPPLGDWVYFTDNANYSFRRVNIKTGVVETVAGSKPPVATRNPLGQSGLPFDTRFSSPGPVSFNIKGYIDILDGNSSTKSSVRRYYLPRWGTGTWDNFDTTYIANCDRDTITPEYALGRLRVITGKDLTAVINGTIFAPKDTGAYLLGYYMKIGRCDTTFYKTVKVVAPPRSDLRGDSTCLAFATLAAKLKRDTTLRYKWFGPDNKNLAIVANDTARVINVSQSGKYYVRIFYGKKGCFLFDSAMVLLSPPSAGQIVPPVSIPNGAVYVDSAKICFGTNVNLTMKEKLTTQPKFKRFLWSTGETTPTITALGSATYVALAVDSLGCEVKATFKVIQQPQPNFCFRVIDDVTRTTLPYGRYDVSTFAGSGVAGGTDGIGTGATFNSPTGLFLRNDTLWVTDKAGQLVRTVNLSNGAVQTFMGSYGDAAIQDSTTKTAARLKNPAGITVDKAGNVYVSNQSDNTIYKYDRKKNIYANFAGSGLAGFRDSTGAYASFNQPAEIKMDAAGNLFVADESNHSIRTVFANRKVGTFAGSKGGGSGAVNGKGTIARFNQPIGLAFDPAGNLFVAENFNHTVRKANLDTAVTLSAGQFTTSGFVSNQYYRPIAGASSLLNRPASLTSDNAGNIYFTDAANGVIRKLDINGNVSTVAGNPTLGTYRNGRYDSASFQNPAGIALDPKTGSIYVADAGNNVIRKLTKSKIAYVCKGNNYVLGDTCSTPGITWQKRTATGLRNLTATDLIIGFKDTATYIATKRTLIGNVTCTQVVDSVIVKWKTSNKKITMNLDAPAKLEICTSDTLHYSATAGFSQYIWSEFSNFVLPDTTQLNKFNYIFPLSTVYRPIVTGLDPESGCYTSDTAKAIFLYQTPKALFADTFTCLGNTTLFTPADADSSFFTYQWDFGDTGTADISYKTITQYKYAQPGTYQVKLKGRLLFSPGCPDSVTRSIVIRPGPIAAISVNGMEIDTLKLCGTNGTTLNLSATVTPPSATAIFNWKEIGLKDGGLDSTQKGSTTTAKPISRAGQYTSAFGYSVYVNDGGSCEGPPDTLVALLGTVPRFSVLASDTSICRGASLTLTPFDSLAPTFAPNDYVYKWDSAGVQVNADSNQAQLDQNPLNSVTYTLTMKNKITSCSSSESIYIKVSDFRLGLPSIPPPTPCTDPDTITYEASALGTVVNPLKVQWLDSISRAPSATISPTNNLKVAIFRDTLRTYLLKIEDATGCTDSAYIVVHAPTKQVPTVNIIPNDTSFCANGSVQVKIEVTQANPPLRFNWIDGVSGGSSSEVDSSDPLNPIFTPRGSSPVFVVEVRDQNNCGVAKDTIELTSYDNMTLSLTTSQLTGLCRSSANPTPSASLQVKIQEGNAQNLSNTYVYEWRNTSTGQLVGSTDAINASAAGMYVVQVVNTLTTCVNKDSAFVGILNEPEGLTVATDQPTETCNNKPIKLIATMDAPASAKSDSLTFTWSVVGGATFNTSSDSAVTFVPSPSDIGTLLFNVEVKNRCGSSNGTTSVKLLEGTRAVLEATPVKSFINKDVVFVNRSLNTDSLNILVLGDGKTVNFGYGLNETTTHAYTTPGKFLAKLYAFNKNGCNSVDSVVIDVSNKQNIYVPTVFSPSANHEDNRYFRVYGQNINAEGFSLVVYNKWGQQVYSSTNLYQAMSVGWDGSDGSGEAQMGVYTFILQATTGNGLFHRQTGSVTLLR